MNIDNIPRSFGMLLQNTIKNAITKAMERGETRGVKFFNRTHVHSNGAFGAHLWRIAIVAPGMRRHDVRDYDIFIVPRGTDVSIGGVPFEQHFDVSK